MPKRVGKYPKAFRQMAVERMRNCANVSALAEELGVDRTVLYHWRRLTPGEAGSADASPRAGLCVLILPESVSER